MQDQLPSTPAGRMASWVVARTAAGGADLTKEDLVEHMDETDLEQVQGWFARDLGQFLVGGFTLSRVLESSDHVILLAVDDGRGRPCEWRITVDEEPPHHLRDNWIQRALPPGVEIRVARPEDGPALREVARRAPLRLGDVSVSIDPGEDYFAAERLMGPSAVTFVATHEATPIGIHAGVSYPVRVAGRDGFFYLIAHSRLLPEHTGGGVWGRLNNTVFDHAWSQQGDYISGVAYVRPENAAAQRLGGADSRWSVRPFRAVLDCGALASAGAGRPAAPDDASRIVELLNACHEGEELFVPYTEETLALRLSRAPDLYGWSDLLVGDRAVVGAWRSGEIRTIHPDGGEPEVSHRAAVLDYAFGPGGEDELEAILRAWCARLSPDVTHLGVFSSPASRASDTLRRLACSIEEYDICPPNLEEPPATATNGIYVDAVYF